MTYLKQKCRWAGLLAIVLAAFLAPATNSHANGQPSDDAVVYKASRVYVSPEKVLEPGQVLVVGGKIKAVGKSVNAPSGCKEVDLGTGSSLIPGLVNAYTQAGASGDEVTREITPDFQVADTVDLHSIQLLSLRQNGVTSACVCPDTNNVLAGLACLIKTAGNDRDKQIINPAGPLIATLCSDPAQRNSSRRRPDSIYVRQPTNRMGVIWMLRNGFHQAKTTNTDTLENVRQAVDGKRSLFFVSRKMHDINAVMSLADEFGFSPVIIGGHEANQMSSVLAQRNVPVVISSMTTGAMRGIENTELSWNLAGELSRAGVSYCISGDDLLRRARFAHRFGLTEQQALAAVTTGPAGLLGIQDRVGSIKAGMDADMVALNGNPLEFTSNIEWVMVDGELNEMNKEN